MTTTEAPRGRLTEAQRADRAITEREFQGLVCELAGILGWAWLHIRPGQTEHGWRTPIAGPLGKGWPDLVLVSPGRRKTIAVELKRELAAPPTPDQVYVHGVLESAGWTVRVWRPSDLTSGAIQAELSR
jgi:hypothetical protein